VRELAQLSVRVGRAEPLFDVEQGGQLTRVQVAARWPPARGRCPGAIAASPPPPGRRADVGLVHHMPHVRMSLPHSIPSAGCWARPSSRPPQPGMPSCWRGLGRFGTVCLAGRYRKDRQLPRWPGLRRCRRRLTGGAARA
jgi:hypothetical protein